MDEMPDGIEPPRLRSLARTSGTASVSQETDLSIGTDPMNKICPSSRGLLTLLLVVFSVGCAGSGEKNGGSFVKVPAHKKKSESASSELKLAAAMVCMRDEQYSEARKIFKDILEKDPDCVDAILGIARLDELAMRSEEAEKGYRLALEKAPNNARVATVVAQYYASVEDYPKAAQLLERAIDLDPDQKAYHYELAVVLTRQGKLDESLPHFTQSVGAGAAHYNVGRILYDQKRYDESEQHFLQALNKNPNLGEAQQWLREVRRSRDGELARRVAPQRSSPAIPTTVPQQTQPVAQTSAAYSNPASQQIMTTGNSTQIVPGGVPAIATSQPQTAAITPTVTPSAQAPLTSHPAGNAAANTPSHPPADQRLTPGALTPAQLEQMRNQQLRSQTPAAPTTPAWDTPRAY